MRDIRDVTYMTSTTSKELMLRIKLTACHFTVTQTTQIVRDNMDTNVVGIYTINQEFQVGVLSHHHTVRLYVYIIK